MIEYPKIVFIGSGNLATQLSIALHKAGYNILQVYSRTEVAAKELADQLNCSFTTDVSRLTTEGELYICALKDSVISEVLKQTNGVLKDKVLVHTAGSIPMNILREFSSKCGVLYPMQTFTKSKMVDFSKVHFLLEGQSKEVSDLLTLISSSLSDHLFYISSEGRKKIHLSAVFACNFANHAYSLGAEIAQSAGVPFEALLPLIEETAEKVHSIPPSIAQSGPAVRNDVNVMEEHLRMLSDYPTMKMVYEIMSKSIHELDLKSKNV